jgi:heme A synthase
MNPTAVIGIHASLGTAVILFNLLLGVWALIKYLRGEQGIDGSFAGAVALSPMLGVVQIAVGAVLIALGYGGAPRLIHYLYGVLCVLSVPAAFAFTRGRDDRGMLLIYSMILFFVCICGFRAYTAVYSGGV